MAVLATGGDRPAPEGLKHSGGRRKGRLFCLREEAEHSEAGKKVGRRRCGKAIGAQPEPLVDNRPSSEAAHMRDRCELKEG